MNEREPKKTDNRGGEMDGNTLIFVTVTVGVNEKVLGKLKKWGESLWISRQDPTEADRNRQKLPVAKIPLPQRKG